MPDIELDKRKIVPVRLITYATGWQLKPIHIAKMLAHNQDRFYNIHLFAYHLKQDQTYTKMNPKDWDTRVMDLKELNRTLKEKNAPFLESDPVWCQQLFSRIPAATFVWLDELETAYKRTAAPHRLVIGNDERAGDRELNPDPPVPPELFTCLYEGFESFLPSHRKTDKQPVPARKKAKSQREISKEATQKRDQGITKRMKELQKQYPDINSKTRLAYKLLKEGNKNLIKQSGRETNLSPEAIVRITNRHKNIENN